MMRDARRRRFDVVAASKFDRFARSTSHLLKALDEFKALADRLPQPDREYRDTSTPVGKMLFTILGTVGELERCLIAERVRAGVRHAKAKGKHLGRPAVKFYAQRVSTLRQRGASIRSIARELGISVGKAQETVRKSIVQVAL